MTDSGSHAIVVQAARRLFAERGYTHVTVRQIAAEAGVSPALVMKLCGSKRDLYDLATPPDPEPLDPSWPHSQIGRELVRRILDRRESGTADPWIRALMAVQDSPDPVAARREFAEYHISRLKARVGEAGPSETATEVMAALLVGLAVAVRTLGLLESDREWVIEQCGAMIQDLVDGIPVSRTLVDP